MEFPERFPRMMYGIPYMQVVRNRGLGKINSSCWIDCQPSYLLLGTGPAYKVLLAPAPRHTRSFIASRHSSERHGKAQFQPDQQAAKVNQAAESPEK